MCLDTFALIVYLILAFLDGWVCNYVLFNFVLKGDKKL